MAVTPKQFMQNFSAKAWKSELESPFDCLIYNPICVQQIMDLKNLNTCSIWTTEQTMAQLQEAIFPFIFLYCCHNDNI